jgi:hypothetical protein
MLWRSLAVSPLEAAGQRRRGGRAQHWRPSTAAGPAVQLIAKQVLVPYRHGPESKAASQSHWRSWRSWQHLSTDRQRRVGKLWQPLASCGDPGVRGVLILATAHFATSPPRHKTLRQPGGEVAKWRSGAVRHTTATSGTSEPTAEPCSAHPAPVTRAAALRQAGVATGASGGLFGRPFSFLLPRVN